MGAKESLSISSEVYKQIRPVHGVCLHFAVLETFPDGYPPRDRHDEIVRSIVEHYQKFGFVQKGIAPFNYVLNMFWDGKSFEDIAFRSPSDPHFREILDYAYINQHPVTISIPVSWGGNHAVGTRFNRPKSGGVVWEIVYGLEGNRPLLDVETGRIIKDTKDKFFTPEMLFHNKSALIIWPSLADLKYR